MSRLLVKNLSFFKMGNPLRIEFFFIKAIYHNFYWFTCVTVYFLHLKQLFHSSHALKMFCMLYIPINSYWCINQLLILLIIIIIIIIIIIKMMLIMGVKQWTFFVWIYENDNSLYYTHFESLVAPVIWLALIGAIYSWIAPFFALNCIFFPANEEATLKTKQSIRFQDLFKVTNQIAGKWKTTSVMWQILHLLFPNSYFFSPKKWMNLISNQLSTASIKYLN